MAMTSKQYAADSNSNEMHSTPQKKASSQSNLNLSLNSNNEKSKRQKSKEADWVEKYNDDDVEIDVEDDEVDKNSDDSIPHPSREQNKEEYHMRNTHNYVDKNHGNNENHTSKTTNSALQKGKKPPTNPFSGKDHIFFLIFKKQIIKYFKCQSHSFLSSSLACLVLFYYCFFLCISGFQFCFLTLF